MKKHAVFLLPVLIFCATPSLRAGETTVSFKTADGCTLEAFYLAPSSGAYVFVNSHGLGSDKNEWRVFETALEKAGIGYLSFDFRGHGRSLKCGGTAVDYRNFTAAEWPLLSRDIKAAVGFLRSKKTPQRMIILCGASIGANLSVKAAAEGLAPAGVALLSPGLEYAGVNITDFFHAGSGARLFIAAAPDDVYAWKSSLYLARLAKKKKIAISFRAGASGHGVKMFTDGGSSLSDDILGWTKNLKNRE